MDAIIIAASDLVRRLAATIPTASGDQSTIDHLKQFAAGITTTQCMKDLVVLTIVDLFALELMSNLVYHVPKLFTASSIPVRGKHLDNFSWKDKAFIAINKCMTGIFIFCYFGYLWSVRKEEGSGDHHDEHHEHEGHHRHDHHRHASSEKESMAEHHHCCDGGKGVWESDEISFVNTILPIPVLFITYDFFYTLLHWFLHVKSIYAYVHKHHHHQKAPSRATVDAVNVHPLEFFLGEFNHLLALHLVVRGMPLIGFHGMDVSSAGATLFLAMGGVLAGLNHTRHDVTARIPSSLRNANGEEGGWTIYDSKHHDVHHRIPQSNYGQYTVFWDRIFGTFREYNNEDRINPAYQLDPSTGKTLSSVKSQ
ncbi:hypothetical protein ACHAWU_005444 [Discostella pseudostelligera]|uniref:Fatty acid hydroxylase domain-containing protein n=1 Tax=Discostella pseudostelligera TaxID=259834 RepID=A0ABD3MVN5_9STRA